MIIIMMIKPSEYKRNKNQGKEKEWKEKVMHGQYLRDKIGVDWTRTWQWVTTGDLKGCTESLIFSAQEQALRTNCIKFHIDKTVDSPLCRMCGERGTTVEARRPDIVFVDKKKREIKILDVAVPGDGRVKGRELKKIEKLSGVEGRSRKDLGNEESQSDTCGD